MNYTIGKVSKLVGLSIKTLRYYEQINLIKPAERNPQSGYRYYTQEQITTLTAIKYLNLNCGLSLSDINELFKQEQPANSTFIGCLENAEERMSHRIEKLQKSREILRGKIAHLKHNQEITLNTPLIKHIPERNYYLKTTQPIAAHDIILDEMFHFRNELNPALAFQMAAYIFSDPGSTSLSWQNNGICLITEEDLPAPRMIMKEGDYLSIFFNNPFENFETNLQTLKIYIHEHQLTADANFFLVIDTFDGAISWNIDSHLFDLQIRLLH